LSIPQLGKVKNPLKLLLQKRCCAPVSRYSRAFLFNWRPFFLLTLPSAIFPGMRRYSIVYYIYANKEEPRMINLLQIVDSTSRVAQSDINKDGEISIGELLTMGGWIMVPLMLLFLLAIYLFFERLIALRKASNIDGNFMNIVRDHIMNGNVSAARSFAKNTNNPVARIIDKGIQRIGKPIENIERSMENVGKLELYNLEKNLSVLALIAGIAPMFGFLGTIVGMFQLFYNLASTGEFTIQSMANGIYTKMITSAVGLIIGLIAYIAHNYLNSQVDKTANRMEAASSEFIDILQEPTR
jgi:biopolymer transport protein ExbB